MALHGFIKTVLFETPMLVATMLILGGIVLLWVDRRPERPRYEDAMDFSLPMALKVGLFQCLALVPGVSRSGATIVGALLLGASKRVGGGVLLLPLHADHGRRLRLRPLQEPPRPQPRRRRAHRHRLRLRLPRRAVLVVSRLLDFVSRRGYAVFGWWRIAVGGAALLALLAGR